MEERPKLPYYDPDYCLKVAKWTASICFGFLIVELLVLFVVDPSDGRCPGWTIYAKNGPVTPLWILVASLTAPLTIWICYVVFHWNYYSQKIYYSIAYGRQKFLFLTETDPQELNINHIFLLNFNRLFLEVCIAWCLFCTFPLWLMIAVCTNIPRYLGF